MNKISAVIFDLDGTVLDDEDEYGTAFKKVLQSLGAKDIPEISQVAGIGVQENWPILLERYEVKTEKTFEELATETQEEYLKLLPRVTVKKDLQIFINKLRERGIKTALATSNTWNILEKVFTALSIEKYFDSITTGEEVVDKKPAPDLFLVAADKLAVKPEECLVIEDAPSGVEAAHGAGMKVTAIARNDKLAEELKDADLVVRGYNQLNVGTI